MNATATAPAPTPTPSFLTGLNGHNGHDSAASQLTLLEAHRSASVIVDFSVSFYTPMLMRYLIQVKQLPSFYFHEAAREMGVTPDQWKNVPVHEWPEKPPLLDHTILAEMMFKVLLRVIHYPEHESFHQALERLRARYHALVADGFSHNRIAQHLEITHHQLTRVVKNADDDRSRPKRCPWRLLEQLENAEDEISTRPVRPLNYERPVNNNLDPDLPPKPARTYLTSRQAKCTHCHAPPHNLKPDGVDAYGDRRYVCVICSRDNWIEGEPPVPAPLPALTF